VQLVLPGVQLGLDVSPGVYGESGGVAKTKRANENNPAKTKPVADENKNVLNAKFFCGFPRFLSGTLIGTSSGSLVGAFGIFKLINFIKYFTCQQ